jgi:GntR family phosphonate transport system transcriptional regulator
MTDLRRRAGTTLWQQIGAEIAEEIGRGDHDPGTRLPPEPELMERFGVSRSSVRRAMFELEAQGLVRVQQGRGTFVHEHGPINYPISDRTRFSQNLIDQGREPSARTVREATIAAPPHVATALRLPRNEPVHHLVRLSAVDGAPISIGNVYYPARRFPDLPKRRRTRSDVTSVYAEYGVHDYVRVETLLAARLPTPEEARALNQPRSRPVVIVRKLDADMRGVPIAYAETAWAAERVQFSIKHSALQAAPPAPATRRRQRP